MRASDRPTAIGINQRGLTQQYAALFRHILSKHCGIDTEPPAPTIEIDCKPFLNPGALMLKMTPLKNDDGQIADHEKWALAAHAIKKFTGQLRETFGDLLLYEDYTTEQMNIRFQPRPMMAALNIYTTSQGDEDVISARHLDIIRSIQERIDLLRAPPQPSFSN